MSDRNPGEALKAMRPTICSSCGHAHQGKHLAFICIGCPCPERPGREEASRKDQMQTHCGVAETLDGTAIGEHLESKPNGQQKDYVVLTAAERAKGFVEPVRRSYVHAKCGTMTTMGQELAETYARCPDFYSGTFCCGCGAHFHVGESGEFVWAGTDQKVGTTQKPHACADEKAAK
jgi:hypothetical protein